MAEYSVPHPGPLTTAAVLLLASMTIMSNATISPSLPGFREHFADVEGIETLAGLVLTLPSLSVLLTASTWGWMVDRLDRQRLLVVAALTYGIGGVSGLVAETLPQMLAGRALLGVGVAGTMTLAMAWGTDLWHGAERARFMGLQGAAISLGGIAVVVGGGALAVLHWRGAFAIYALALPIAVFALVQLAPWARLRAAAGVGEEHHRPAVPAGRFPWAVYAFVGPLAFFFMTVFYVIPTRIPFLLEERGVTNALAVGGAMAVMMIASLPGALFYERIRRFVSAMPVFAVSFLIMGAGLAVIALAGGLIVTLLGILISGLGMGPLMPNFTVYFMEFVPPLQRGRAAGLLTTGFYAGQFAAPLVSAPLVALFGLPGAFGAFAAILALLGAILGMVTIARKHR